MAGINAERVQICAHPKACPHTHSWLREEAPKTVQRLWLEIRPPRGHDEHSSRPATNLSLLNPEHALRRDANIYLYLNSPPNSGTFTMKTAIYVDMTVV